MAQIIKASEIRNLNRYKTILLGLMELSTSRCKKVGAIVTRDGYILGQGYNGSSRSIVAHEERNGPIQEKISIRPAHAEMRSISTSISRDLRGSTIWTTHIPCSLCQSIIDDAGITTVIYMNGNPEEKTLNFYKYCNIRLIKFEDLYAII